VFSGRVLDPVIRNPKSAITMNLTVERVERIPISVPYREVPRRNMIRELPHWTIFEICKVTLGCGVTGFGETMQYYTFATVSDETIARVTGKNAAESMWDDTLGAGLQMALFDAVGRATDTPVWALLGQKYRDRPHISWWDIDMPGEDWVLECRQAMEEGYTDFKTKARPWWDLDEQCRTLCGTLPDWFDVDLDFNAFLNDAAHATRLLTHIERYPHVEIYESPIPQGDVAGNKFIRSHTRVAIAHHFGSPPIMTALKEDVCDGFVIGGGATRVMREAAVSAAADKPFFLQLVGTGITATWALHFGAVLTHARWPSVNCHQLYTHHMVLPRISVANGAAKVPDAPGLGVELDEEAVEQFRFPEMPPKPYPTPGLLIAIRFGSGATSYYAHCQQYWDDFGAGRLPVFQPGTRTEVVPDNGTSEWRELQERAQAGGVHCAGREL
jgi:L-alanine-DL-glutamate epimerase-like enolase superfamily enzyme